jgi:hypothetical protein
MPQNFLHIPVIVNAFPEAKIIHVKRDARAVCWSNFKTFFNSDGLGYSYDLTDCVSYYNEYTKLVSFYQQLLPNKIIDVDYDSTTRDPVNGVKELLARLGLTWQEQCLFPELNQNTIKTASFRQARRPIYSGSSSAWVSYKSKVTSYFDKLQIIKA